MAPTYALRLVLFLAVANAWTLTWRNETDGPVIEGQYTAQSCTRIYHEKGLPFKWDPEGPWCLNFWDNPDCTTRIGLSCDGVVWTKDASRNLSAFNVYPMPDDLKSMYGFLTAAPTSTPGPTATTLTVTQPVATSTDSTTSATPTASPEDKPASSSLSGGAIAGIVVGAVAGLALLAALCFFLGKRKPNATHSVDVPVETGPPHPPVSPPGTSASHAAPQFVPTQASGFPIENKAPMAMASPPLSQYSQAAPPYSPPVSVYQHPAARRVVELPSEQGGLGVMGSRQLSEMDGSSEAKPYLR